MSDGREQLEQSMAERRRRRAAFWRVLGVNALLGLLVGGYGAATATAFRQEDKMLGFMLIGMGLGMLLSVFLRLHRRISELEEEMRRVRERRCCWHCEF